MTIVYHTLDYDALEVVFSAEAERNDYGVAQSPIWWEIKDSSIWIESISFLGSSFSTKQFEDKFGTETIKFIYETLVERLPDEVEEWESEIY